MNQELTPRLMKTIYNFWFWFEDNEQALYNAYKLDSNKAEMEWHFKRNLNYVSRRIKFYITDDPQIANKLKLFITAHDYRKLFPKINALEENRPFLDHFSIQFYIPPFNPENPSIPKKLIETIQNTKVKLENYNIATKKVILTLYLQEYEMKETIKSIKQQGYLLLLFTLGEVNYKKYIHDFDCQKLPQHPSDLLDLTELPELLENLSEIDYSRKLKIFFE
ncbi:hypothetical protein FLCU109888_13130 [Flavobacterium cucumis]|uniref:Uncharacterized protein n=1 Tax=Flavobacterium cucumis TaxID=416016 RepID=A0A1M7ZYY5_9FLAO|nr:hypothetical protein [Flavobacterium cucumis]SHO74020.1 hypothetical protein SAMN05443547_2400 [Flavobacterium cucumis]